MSNQEFIIEGWTEISKLFKVSRQTMIKRKDELQQYGAIFYRMKGSPPHKVVCAFPSILKAWISEKSIKGNVF